MWIDREPVWPSWFEAFCQLRVLRPIDQYLVQFCLSECPQSQIQPDFQYWAGWLVLASAQVQQGHVCLDLEQALQQPRSLLPASLELPSPLLRQFSQWCQAKPLAQLIEMLQSVPMLVQSEASNSVAPTDAMTPSNAPFVLRAGRLYLARYAHDEALIAQFIRRRQSPQFPEKTALTHAMNLWFGPLAPDAGFDWQRMAGALAASRAFTVITGGPGTGKTTTVVKLLGVLQSIQPNRSLQIGLAAPTGKAAARLSESIEQAITRLDANQRQLLAGIRGKAATVHRLLGQMADGQWRHHAYAPLPFDVLVVDEASMLDVELCARLLDAVSDSTRLILLGDKDQLASVEAGGVMAELCKDALAGRYLPQTAAYLLPITGQALPDEFIDSQGGTFDQQVVMLRHSHRFSANSGIGQLAHAVNRGEATQALALLSTSNAELSCWQGSLRKNLQSQVWPVVKPWFELASAEGDLPARAAQLLQYVSQFQLLCAVRQGPSGVEQVNRELEQIARLDGVLVQGGDWYPGRLVMIRQNDYSTGLMNGDIGICLADAHQQLHVAFSDGRGGVRLLLPSRLAEVETAFALTVHKSQGSEYQQVALVLPEQDSLVLSRELIYTAITRAKQQFSLYAPELSVLAAAIQRATTRRGGLRLSL